MRFVLDLNVSSNGVPLLLLTSLCVFYCVLVLKYLVEMNVKIDKRKGVVEKIVHLHLESVGFM
jgi:hypothetical protein